MKKLSLLNFVQIKLASLCRILILGSFFYFPCHSFAQEPLPLTFVRVGDAGNTADISRLTWQWRRVGAVDHIYRISKYEVTVGQYLEFLNAVDPQAEDAHRLWQSKVQVGRNTARPAGQRYFAVAPSSINNPILTNFLDAARFSNWLHNGKGGVGTSEGNESSGAYDTRNFDSRDVTLIPRSGHNFGARFWVPTEDEWIKAAHYKGGGLDRGYWIYPYRSDQAVVCEMPPGGTNSSACATSDRITPIAEVPVNSYPNSISPYGLLGVAGNAHEWTESWFEGDLGLPSATTFMMTRGGHIRWLYDHSGIGYRFGTHRKTPFDDRSSFRVAALPEGPNRAPQAINVSRTVPANLPTAITLAADDGDGNALKFKVLAGPGSGSLSGTPPHLIYTPASGFTGTDSFTFQALDGMAISNTGTVNLKVENVLRILPTNDLYVTKFPPDQTNGRESTLKNEGEAGLYETYIRFDLPSSPALSNIDKAYLRLFPTETTARAQEDVYAVSPGSVIDENTTTYNTRPISETLLARAKANIVGRPLEIDITSEVLRAVGSNQKVLLHIKSSNKASYFAREASDQSLAPSIVVLPRDNAAQAITSCRSISAPGLYELRNAINISTHPGGSACLNITSRDVVLDCKGFSITSNVSNFPLVQGIGNRSEIRNCELYPHSNSPGIFLSNSRSSYIHGNSIFGSAAGIRLNNADGYSTTDRTKISENLVESNIYGLYFLYSNNLLVTDNTVFNNSAVGTADLYDGENNIYLRNTIERNGLGFYLRMGNRIQFGSETSSADGNFIRYNQRGMELYFTNDGSFAGNTVSNNSRHGMMLYGGVQNGRRNRFVNNTVTSNGSFGFGLDSAIETLVSGNNVCANSAMDFQCMASSVPTRMTTGGGNRFRSGRVSACASNSWPSVRLHYDNCQ